MSVPASGYVCAAMYELTVDVSGGCRLHEGDAGSRRAFSGRQGWRCFVRCAVVVSHSAYHMSTQVLRVFQGQGTRFDAVCTSGGVPSGVGLLGLALIPRTADNFTAPPQYPLSAVRWGCWNAPGPVWARDFCYFEYGAAVVSASCELCSPIARCRQLHHPEGQPGDNRDPFYSAGVLCAESTKVTQACAPPCVVSCGNRSHRVLPGSCVGPFSTLATCSSNKETTLQ